MGLKRYIAPICPGTPRRRQGGSSTQGLLHSIAQTTATPELDEIAVRQIAAKHLKRSDQHAGDYQYNNLQVLRLGEASFLETLEISQNDLVSIRAAHARLNGTNMAVSSQMNAHFDPVHDQRKSDSNSMLHHFAPEYTETITHRADRVTTSRWETYHPLHPVAGVTDRQCHRL
jgi:Leucine-rich repeat (LRR) protein